MSSTLATGVSSTALTALSVDSNSLIDASGKGCRGSTTTENGFGPNALTVAAICQISSGGFGYAGNAGGGGAGGAAHAGAGGVSVGGGAAQNNTYGSSTFPILSGSGGGGGYRQAPGAGGDGGGRVFLSISGPVAVDGQILSNGNDGLYLGAWNAGGGGSGGSINIQANSFSGTGILQANGGDGGTVGGGGGGGGRIALAYSSYGFSGTTSTNGGTGGSGGAGSGEGGSIFHMLLNVAPNVPSLLGPTALVDGSTTGTANPALSFTLSDPDVLDTVKYQIQIDDSADFSSVVVDYTGDLAVQGSFEFQVGQAQGSGAYTIGTNGQTLSNGSYYWRVKTIDPVAAESSYTTANSGSVAFTVDATPRSIGFESGTLSGLESETATSVRIVLDTVHFETVSVDYAVYSPSSTAEGVGTDYVLAAGTATITAGQTSTTISLTIVDDSIVEMAEDLVIALSSPAYAVLGVNGTSTYTILDNDTAGITVSPTSLSLSEGGASSTYSLVLTSQPTSTIRITLTASAQVTVSTSSVDFTSDNWSTPQIITINATQDTSQEGTHVGTVAHAVTVPSGYAYGYSSGPSVSTVTATIADDESASVAVSVSSLSIIEGRSGSVTVLLGTAPTTTVEVFVTAGSGLAVSTSTLTFDASSYATPATITVTPMDDSVYTGNRSSLVSLTVSTTAGGYAALTLSDVAITIVEDERTGGGAVGGGSGGGSVSPIAFIVPVAQSTQTPTVLLPPAPPSITVVPEPPTNSLPLTMIPGTTEVVTILNPSDVLSLVRATQGSRDFEREGIVIGRLVQDLGEMRVTATEAQKLSLSNFITYGISERTHALGEGERRALVRDALETMRTANISPIDIERLTRGLIPGYRNLIAERAQLNRAQMTFRSIYGRDPNFQNAEENLAWNTLMYRIRFPRDLAAEQEGIREFRRLFGRVPRDPFQWATVRVLGYVR